MKPFVTSRSWFQTLVALMLIGCLLLQTGCMPWATIVEGKVQTIEVTSDPPGAEVFVDGKQMSLTPAEIIVRRKGTHTLRFEKVGYDPVEVKMKRGLNGWLTATAGVVLFWGWTNYRYWGGGSEGLAVAAVYAGPFAALCLGIDYATGAAFKYRPSRIEVKLSELSDTGVTP